MVLCFIRIQLILNINAPTTYDPSDEGSILWDDPDLDISWPIENPKLSAKMLHASKLWI